MTGENLPQFLLLKFLEKVQSQTPEPLTRKSHKIWAR
jgi:hypothetical protein